MKIFQILHGRCHWQTPFTSLAETEGRFPPDCLFVEAPDYVNEQWGFDETEIGDDRFIKPVPPEGFVYDDETGQMYPEEMLATLLEESKLSKQDENNAKLAKFLSDNPMQWTDGKYYGVTMDDQNEMAMNIMSYEMSVQAGVEGINLEWHPTKEACVVWSYEDMIALSLAIRQYVYPWYQLNQTYKTAIFACTSVKEVQAINLVYEWPTEEETAAEETEQTTDEVVDEAITEETEVVEEETPSEQTEETPTEETEATEEETPVE